MDLRKTCRLCQDERPAVADQLCNVHYVRRRKGMADWDTRPIRRKNGDPWPHNGYLMRYAPGHPNANSGGAVFEHVVVMSAHLGRGLLKHESVHHINGDRADNRISNLELWSVSQPPGQRVEDKVTWAKEILAHYEEGNQQWR